MELTAEQIAANKLVEDTKIKEAAEMKANIKKEALREISKEYGINAFEPEELKKKLNEFTTWQTDQKTEQEKLQEQVDLFDKEKTDWTAKELGYQTKIEAGRLGIDKDNLVDAMALAGNDPSKLEEVVKKYPIFKSKKSIIVGVNQDDKILDGQTEMEKHMAQNYAGSKYNRVSKK